MKQSELCGALAYIIAVVEQSKHGQAIVDELASEPIIQHIVDMYLENARANNLKDTFFPL